MEISEPIHNPVPAQRAPLWLSLTLWAGVALVVFILGFFPLRASTDEWWQLKTGKWIVENGWRLPEKDIFTYTAADYDWHNHEWMSQAIMFLIWRWGEENAVGGWRAVIAAKSLVLVLTWLLLCFFLWKRCGGDGRGLWIAVFWTLVAAAVGRRMFWARPPVVTNFFVVLFLYVLWLHRVGRLRTPWLLVLPLIMPLWANLHGGFLLGGFIVAAYFAGEFLEWIGLRLRGRTEPDALRAKRLRWIEYLVLGAMCGLASLLTPYGLRLYFLHGRVMGDQFLVSILSELLPPDLRYTWAWLFLAVFLAIGLLVMIARSLRGRPVLWPPLAEIMLALFFFRESASHMRHMIFLGLTGVPLAVWMTREWRAAWLDADGKRRRDLFFRIGLPFASVFLTLWLLFFPGEAWPLLRDPSLFRAEAFLQASAAGRSWRLLRNQRWLSGLAEEPGQYPRQAVRFILQSRPPGRMYNRNNVCGYLIWALSPEHYRLFTDNRFDIFGGDFLRDELTIANAWPSQPAGGVDEPALPDWRELIERHEINWLFLDRGEILHERLVTGAESGWLPVYADRKYVIWIRDTESNRAWAARWSRIPISAEGGPRP